MKLINVLHSIKYWQGQYESHCEDAQFTGHEFTVKDIDLVLDSIDRAEKVTGKLYKEQSDAMESLRNNPAGTPVIDFESIIDDIDEMFNRYISNVQKLVKYSYESEYRHCLEGISDYRDAERLEDAISERNSVLVYELIDKYYPIEKSSHIFRTLYALNE